MSLTKIEVNKFYVLPKYQEFFRNELKAWIEQKENNYCLILEVPYCYGTQSFYGKSLEEAQKIALEKCKYQENYADRNLIILDHEIPYKQIVPTVRGYEVVNRPNVEYYGRYTKSYSQTTQIAYGENEMVGKKMPSWGDNNLGKGYGCGYVPKEIAVWNNQVFQLT